MHNTFEMPTPSSRPNIFENASKQIRYVATDMDNTLLSINCESLHDTNLEAIALLKKKDILLIPVTGRNPSLAQQALEAAGLPKYPGGFHHGAITYGVNGEVITNHKIDFKDMPEVCLRTLASRLHWFPVCILAQSLDAFHYLDVGVNHCGKEEIQKKNVKCIDGGLPKSDIDYYQLTVFIPFEDSTGVLKGAEERERDIQASRQALQDMIEEAGIADKYRVMISAQRFVDLVNIKTSKSNAVRAILREIDDNHSIEEHVIGLGDSQNDLDLIQQSKLSVAMSNGLHLLKQSAHIVTEKTCNEGGWGHTLLSILG